MSSAKQSLFKELDLDEPQWDVFSMTYDALKARLAEIKQGADVIAHCAKCGLALTAGSEGECFTVCDQCWESERAMSDAKRWQVSSLGRMENGVWTDDKVCGNPLSSDPKECFVHVVLASDYDALKARLEALEATLTDLASPDFMVKYRKLERDAARLAEAVELLRRRDDGLHWKTWREWTDAVAKCIANFDAARAADSAPVAQGESDAGTN